MTKYSYAQGLLDGARCYDYEQRWPRSADYCWGYTQGVLKLFAASRTDRAAYVLWLRALATPHAQQLKAIAEGGD